MSSVALVTGGNRGIGLSCAQALRAMGLATVAGSRSGQAPDGLSAVAMDVASTQSVDSAFDAVEAEHGVVDVLVRTDDHAGVADFFGQKRRLDGTGRPAGGVWPFEVDDVGQAWVNIDHLLVGTFDGHAHLPQPPHGERTRRYVERIHLCNQLFAAPTSHDSPPLSCFTCHHCTQSCAGCFFDDREKTC